MEKLSQKRQGDILFVKTKKSNFNKKFDAHKKDTLTVALGEVSGHHHTMFGKSEDTEILENVEEGGEPTKRENTNDTTAMFFEVKNGEAVVTHQEHDPVSLEATQEDEVWVRVIQVEHDPFENSMRRVMD